ncbi:MAG: ribonuclease R [Cytophagales bacterium]|nr:MAG: ribonuclease R [Cytophagales bacterium]TAF61499.1 MAG: ribonuclease R [Cytophagales bacterium]
MAKKLPKKTAKPSRKQPNKESLKKIVACILDLLDDHFSAPLSSRQIFKNIAGIRLANVNDFRIILEKMADQNLILRTDEDRYASKNQHKVAKSYEGKVDMVSRDYAYIICQGLEKDVWVYSNNLLHALDGDIVRVEITKKRDRGNLEGRVVEVISRARTEFVGRLELVGSVGFVVADLRKMHQDIFIPSQNLLNAQKNDKVLVEVISWDESEKNPVGNIVKILGKTGDHNAEMHSIIYEFGLSTEFPAKILAQAAEISEGITEEEIAKRRDFRKILTFTIDPHDAKDFDDAISFRILPNQNYEIGIHIADVTHYVREGSALDTEAYKRATSVYLVDRVVPMLPERLSNELCSLRPNEDKLTFSVVLEMNQQAQILDTWIGRTIIHSQRRFSYEEAQERIETHKGDLAEEITLLNNLAHSLTKQRFKNGAIGFETIEVKFLLESNGSPIKVVPKVRKDAHRLIEEFMLLANKAIAEYVYNHQQGRDNNPMVYRIHDLPDNDKLQNLSNYARKFGYETRFSADMDNLADRLNDLIKACEGKPEQNILQQLAIRSMAKAKYSPETIGHFGLSFSHYSHFTSPIRRYPDMMAHRLIWAYMHHLSRPPLKHIEAQCKHTSEMEKRASDAERASIKYKQVELMSRHKGEIFKGIITGLTERGIYVEITETLCEGMCRLSELTHDYYSFDQSRLQVVGSNSGHIFNLGDLVEVEVLEANLEKRTLDLRILE